MKRQWFDLGNRGSKLHGRFYLLQDNSFIIYNSDHINDLHFQKDSPGSAEAHDSWEYPTQVRAFRTFEDMLLEEWLRGLKKD